MVMFAKKQKKLTKIKGLYQPVLGEKGLCFVITSTLSVLGKHTNHVFHKQPLTFSPGTFAQHI